MLISTMVVNSVTEHLMYTGLSEYEARAYVGLLAENPATAYELAKASNIPTSKIYEVIARLEEKGIVSPVAGEGTRKYIPLEPSEFVASRRNMMQSTLRVLSSELITRKEHAGRSYIWNINEYAYFIEKARSMLSQAERTLLLSVWPREADDLAEELRHVEKRGVKVAAIHFGARVRLDVGQVYPHPVQETVYSERGGRGFCLVVDSQSAIMGTLLEEERVEGAYSTNRGFVSLAEEYIKHDIYFMKMVKRFGPQLTSRFGQRYEKLRDLFSDDEYL
jgi:sugar-specific transcriptional regulator TrmB